MYTMVMTIFILIAIFLFGITIMRLGIKGLTYDQLEKINPDLSPVNGFLLGLCLTLVLQSSSASIALLITFLATAKLSLPFAICYLIGANIGTTVTAQIFVWNETHLMFLCLIIGLVLILFPKPKLMLSGCILFGLGVVFSALNGFENLLHMIPSDRIDSLVNSSHNQPISLVGFGTFLTMIIQSSTVVTGVLMSFSHEGYIPLIQIYYVLLGANVGTCLTVYLVSINQPYHARLTAYAHIWINVIGGLIAFPVFIGQPIVTLAQSITNLFEQQVVLVAMFYNIFTGIIFLIFLKPFIKFLTFVHRQ